MNSPDLNSAAAHELAAKPARTALASLAAAVVAQSIAGTARATLASEEAMQAAATTPTTLDTIIVEERREKALTSPKFTEPLRDTPQTVVVIPQDVFLQQGAANLSDVMRNTAGITFAAGEGGGASATSGDSFYMRGFDATNNIFVDGVRDVGAYSRDVYNLEQVEVAKGPAGADIGRGGASGYVNVSTKLPRLENFSAGSASYGFDEKTSGSRQRTTLDVNAPLATKAVQGAAVRLNAFWQDHDAVGRNFAENKGWALAPSLALGLGTPTRAYLAYQHLEQNNRPDYGLPTGQLPGYISPVPVPKVDWSTYYGFTADTDRVKADSVLARVEHDFSADVKLSNQTRYAANEREAFVTTPGQNGTAYVPTTNLLTRSRQANVRHLDILSNQTNLTAAFTTGPLSHRLVGGLELSRENAWSPAFTSVTVTPIAIQSPDPEAVPSATPFRSGASTDVRIDTAALYAFDTIRFSEKWQANASLRTERYRAHYLSVATNGVPTTIDARHNLVSWKGGLVFKPAPAGSLYAAYAVAFTPPGTDFTLSSALGNQNNPDTDPQQTKNLELGVKWDFFRGRFSANAALFRTRNEKTVYTDPVLGAIPAGRQTVQGIEFGATGKLTANWLVLGSVALLDSEIDTGITAGNNPAGSALPLIPRYSGNLWTSYRFSSGLVVGGGTQYVDEVMRRDNNTPAVPRISPSYWLWNALVTYPVSRNVSVRLNVNNLFDKQFVQAANNNGARFNPGAPRSWLLSADFRF
jgi:catecholate siderophore receptor